jgi:competence protein ComEC
MTRDALDLRLAPAALAAWAMAAWGVGWSVGRAVLGGAVLLLAGAVCMLTEHRPRNGEPSAAARSVRLGIALTLVVGGGALAVSGLRAGAVRAGPVPRLAIVRAEVQVTARVTSDPVRVDGTFSPYAVVRLDAARSGWRAARRVLRCAARGRIAAAHVVDRLLRWLAPCLR